MKSSRSATIEKSCASFARPASVADKAPLISLRNVTRHYKTGERAVHALDGVSLEIAPNEFVAVSGPSGCGKSTLIHLLPVWSIQPRAKLSSLVSPCTRLMMPLSRNTGGTGLVSSFSSSIFYRP